MIEKITKFFFKEQKHRDLVTLISLATSLSALAFNVTIIKPWHTKLSKDFDSLNKKITEKNNG